MNTGKSIVFDEESLKAGDDIAEAVQSSASLPGFFIPNEWRGHTFGDGGIYANLQLTEAILKCQEKGFKDQDIIVDVIMIMQYNIDLTILHIPVLHL